MRRTNLGEARPLGSGNVNNLNDSSESGFPLPRPEHPPGVRPQVADRRPSTDREAAGAPPIETESLGWPFGVDADLSRSSVEAAEPRWGVDPADNDALRRRDDASLTHNPIVRLFIEWVPLLLGAFLLAMVVRLFAFQAYSIPSRSMVPTLVVNDRVLVNKLSYDAHDVNRGDLVVFKRPANTEGQFEDLIKRVIGLSGETVRFQNGDVFVNGQLVEESYILEPDSTFPTQGIPGCVPTGTATECTVPSDHVFVLGDNRRGSTDGRVFGPIPEESIVGRAWVRVWPLTNVGLL